MSLSTSEIGAIAVGLIAGFWLVRRIMDGGSRTDRRPGIGGTGAYEGSAQEQPDVSATDVATQPWWVVLGVPRIATRDEISSAYKRRISEYHPDKVAQMGTEIRALAESKSKAINAAYEEAMRGL